MMKICSIPTCEKPMRKRTWCGTHYKRWQSHGDTFAEVPVKKQHGLTHTSEYQIWTHMKARCYKQHDKSYKHYGGRGIKVCDRWLESFEYFLQDMGNRPESLTLDRIDVNGDYEPSNCRWSDMTTQARNKRVQHNNKSGHRGIMFEESSQKWYAYIYVARKLIGLGRHKTLEGAVEARKAGQAKLWGAI